MTYEQQVLHETLVNSLRVDVAFNDYMNNLAGPEGFSEDTLAECADALEYWVDFSKPIHPEWASHFLDITLSSIDFSRAAAMYLKLHK